MAATKKNILHQISIELVFCLNLYYFVLLYFTTVQVSFVNFFNDNVLQSRAGETILKERGQIYIV